MDHVAGNALQGCCALCLYIFTRSMHGMAFFDLGIAWIEVINGMNILLNIKTTKVGGTVYSVGLSNQDTIHNVCTKQRYVYNRLGEERLYLSQLA